MEPWTSEGTPASTHLVQDINALSAGSNPSAVVEVNGMRFFAATDATGNTELWETEGSATTTQLVPVPSSGPSSLLNPTDLVGLAIAACHLSLVLVLTRAEVYITNGLTTTSLDATPRRPLGRKNHNSAIPPT